jgi:hypothetical protein
MKMGLPAEWDDDLASVMVCDRMGWTYDEYLSQPEWFIHSLIEKWSQDNKK